MKKIWLVIAALSLIACGGGGGGSSSGSNSSAPPAPQGTSFIGIYTGLVDYEPISVTDFQLKNLSLEKLYAGERLLVSQQNLTKLGELEGDIYSYNKGLGAIYFAKNKSYAVVLDEADQIGVYQSTGIPAKTIISDTINGSWEGYYFYEYRDTLYQSKITTECTNKICTHTESGTNEKVIIDFAEQYKSDFKAQGAWFGREAAGGERVFSSAVISSDGNFLAMPMCWHTFAFDDEIFFSICDLAVLTRK